MVAIGDINDMLFFPYNSTQGEDGKDDRLYDSQDFADYFKQFIGNGVYPNPANTLKVESLANSMVLTVRLGACFIEGRTYVQKKDFDFSVTPAHLTLGRKDIVIARHDAVARTTQIFYIEGIASATPVVPAITRTADIFDLKLCEITINANAKVITQANIKDTRADSSVCGIVTGLITQVDTTDIFNQYQTALDEFLIDMRAEQMRQKDEWEIQAKHLLELTGAIESGNWTKINQNWDDWSTKTGTQKLIEFPPNGNIIETLTFKANGNAFGNKLTVFNGDTITETVIFVATSLTINGNTITTTAGTATKTTIFNADKTITEVIS